MPNEAVASVLSLEVERNGTTAVIKCHGRLISGVSGQLYDAVCKLLPDTKLIVLDFTDLVNMDSMGLGTLVRIYVSAKTAGTRIELKNIGKKVRELLGMTHLLQVFTVIGESGIKMGF